MRDETKKHDDAWALGIKQAIYRAMTHELTSATEPPAHVMELVGELSSILWIYANGKGTNPPSMGDAMAFMSGADRASVEYGVVKKAFDELQNLSGLS